MDPVFQWDSGSDLEPDTKTRGGFKAGATASQFADLDIVGRPVRAIGVAFLLQDLRVIREAFAARFVVVNEADFA
jgi:hypothetical protein